MTRLLPAIAVIALAMPAAAAELPTRKAGLWEMSMKRESGATAMPTMQQCTDETTDKDMSMIFGGVKQRCAKHDVQNSGGRFTIDSTCTVAGATATSHAEIVGDFNSAYSVNVTTTIEGKSAEDKSAQGKGRSNHMTVEAKWLGPCKAGQSPGDIIMPGGFKMNIKQMHALQRLMPKQ